MTMPWQSTLAALAASLLAGTAVQAADGRAEQAYKETVAAHVVRHNPAQVFEGPLPLMLPAIVVLRMKVDREGRLTSVAVQRARDAQAARVALASVARAGRLPAPGALIGRAASSFEFSETFLFDHDYRFQLRSLAGPQPWQAGP